MLFDRGASLHSSDCIIVTRAGGDQLVDGILARAVDPEFTPFQTNASYLLLLKKVDGSASFKATGAGSFLLSSSDHRVRVAAATLAHEPPSSVGDADQFVEEVRLAIAAAIAEEQGGRR